MEIRCCDVDSFQRDDDVVAAVKPVPVGIAAVLELSMWRYYPNHHYPHVRMTGAHNSTWNDEIVGTLVRVR